MMAMAMAAGAPNTALGSRRSAPSASPCCNTVKLGFLQGSPCPAFGARFSKLELRKAGLRVVNPGGRDGRMMVKAAGIMEAPGVGVEKVDLSDFVKKAMPGGIAAQEILGTGSRKRAVARVCLVEGTGQYVINNRTAQEYLQGNPLWLYHVKLPLASLGYEGKYDTIVKAHGGGLSGQAQAIRLGISRALLKVNESHRQPLRKLGFLTRDARRVERKKVGKHKARKSHQFSKR